MSKHTPGPWKSEVVPAIFNLDGATHQVIATTPDGTDTGTVAICGWFENAEADAHLIAAAPDLLEALQRLIHGPLDRPSYQAARAAIAKATGSMA